MSIPPEMEGGYPMPRSRRGETMSQPHVIVDGYCFVCQGGCLEGFSNDAPAARAAGIDVERLRDALERLLAVAMTEEEDLSPATQDEWIGAIRQANAALADGIDVSEHRRAQQCSACQHVTCSECGYVVPPDGQDEFRSHVCARPSWDDLRPSEEPTP